MHHGTTFCSLRTALSNQTVLVLVHSHLCILICNHCNLKPDYSCHDKKNCLFCVGTHFEPWPWLTAGPLRPSTFLAQRGLLDGLEGSLGQPISDELQHSADQACRAAAGRDFRPRGAKKRLYIHGSVDGTVWYILLTCFEKQFYDIQDPLRQDLVKVVKLCFPSRSS